MEAQHLSDMWSLVAGADAHFESVARLNSADPALSQHTSVEEGIARSIRECDETKSLLGPTRASPERMRSGRALGKSRKTLTFRLSITSHHRFRRSRPNHKPSGSPDDRRARGQDSGLSFARQSFTMGNHRVEVPFHSRRGRICL
jgi:hypothetical protein